MLFRTNSAVSTGLDKNGLWLVGTVPMTFISGAIFSCTPKGITRSCSALINLQRDFHSSLNQAEYVLFSKDAPAACFRSCLIQYSASSGWRSSYRYSRALSGSHHVCETYASSIKNLTGRYSMYPFTHIWRDAHPFSRVSGCELLPECCIIRSHRRNDGDYEHQAYHSA